MKSVNIEDHSIILLENNIIWVLPIPVAVIPGSDINLISGAIKLNRIIDQEEKEKFLLEVNKRHLCHLFEVDNKLVINALVKTTTSEEEEFFIMDTVAVNMKTGEFSVNIIAKYSDVNTFTKDITLDYEDRKVTIQNPFYS